MGNYIYELLIIGAVFLIIILLQRLPSIYEWLIYGAIVILILFGIIPNGFGLETGDERRAEQRARRSASADRFWKSQYSIFAVIGVFLLLLKTIPSIKNNPYWFLTMLLIFLVTLFIYIDARVKIF
jgi:hypothetical protein